ncbi:tpd52 like 2a isoform X1 [Pangasianodon hypophthalmus]|uniref:tpd52 like 2a isoform X1 n=2 Tax=Pangasianodon hypophthalmus TaxID=310915 RepID=UPI000EFDE7D5|nr:tpd52 like 2a isoform X1 [Pangasianodon hypophthalmus]
MQMDSGDRGSFTEGGASARTLPPGLTEQEAVELELELSKVEDEIQTLRHVLTAKERHAGELRRRLGISPLTELKSNLTKGWHEVQSSNAYMKTSQTLGDLNQRITSSNVYLTASATLEDISRSDAYKKTQETLSQAGMMTSSAFSSLGSAIRSRLGEMRALTYTPPSGSSYSMRHSLSMPTMRNSPTFKNLEDKMAGKGSTNGEDA